MTSARWADGVVIYGLSQAIRDVKALTGAADKALVRGTRRWLEMVAERSQFEVPRITGRLAGSMRVQVTTKPVTGTISYNMPYSAIVHEVPRPISSDGKWKFLQGPWEELLPVAEHVIAKEVKAAMKKSGR